MKKSDVKIGATYTAKVSDKLVPVRIDGVHSRQGWNATNTATGRRVQIKSAQRLRGPARTASAADKPKATGAPSSAKSPAGEASKSPPTTDAKPQKARKVSALDAAAAVLKKASKPMRARDLITAMAEQGLWKSPGGKTPHATLYAAMLREIATKGDAARFRRVERGLFEYAG